MGIGAGQQNRVESGEIAATKAAGRAEGGACASDAFYPFPDGDRSGGRGGRRGRRPAWRRHARRRDHRHGRRARPGDGLHRRTALPALMAADGGRAAARQAGGRRGVRRPRAADRRARSPPGTDPGLATILVGDDAASAGYIRMKQEKAAELGFTSPHVHLPADATQADVVAAIRSFNDDPTVDGMLVQHPTPAADRLRGRAARDRPRQGRRRRSPAQHGPPRARHARPGAVHAGRHRGDARPLRDPGRRPRGRASSAAASRSAGRWRCCCRQKRPTANAAVTVVHTGVPDWPRYTSGPRSSSPPPACPASCSPSTSRPARWSSAAACATRAASCCPMSTSACEEVAGWITPRVGGVGPTTIAMLFRNAVEAAERRTHVEPKISTQ